MIAAPFGIEKNNIAISVQNDGGHDRPSLFVYPDAKDMNVRVKVASFTCEEDAEWFIDMVKYLLWGNDNGPVQ